MRRAPAYVKTSDFAPELSGLRPTRSVGGAGNRLCKPKLQRRFGSELSNWFVLMSCRSRILL
ncbi:MAG TPA: hypothetical protein P5180_12985 [Bacteroidales bacterium]|nr:hypothetical protein [Bacteroidales bacterium]HRW86338.1 hypothetical protein [Bacteroidales bacterium]